MRVIAAAGLALASDRLTARVDAAHMRADRTAQSLGIARSVRVDISVVVELVWRDSPLRAIGFGRQLERNAVAPAPADLGGKQFGVDRILVRLQKILKANHVGL